MELRHLRYFAEVARTCHFGRAAQRLHIAQPALSQSVRQLEAELDVTLFTRTTRQVALTPAGEFLQGEVERILAAVDDAVRGAQRLAAGRHGLLRLGLTGTAGFSHLPRIARLLQQELPGVALEIAADQLTPTQCDALRAGSLDLGLLRPPATGAGIELRTVATEPLVLALPADHRLAGAPSIALADLRDEPFVAYDSTSSAVDAAVTRSCRDAGFVPRREHRAPGTSALLALVAAGLGVALAPAGIAALHLDGVVVREVEGAGSVELALAWCPATSGPVVDAVLDVLAAADLGPSAVRR